VAVGREFPRASGNHVLSPLFLTPPELISISAYEVTTLWRIGAIQICLTLFIIIIIIIIIIFNTPGSKDPQG